MALPSASSPPARNRGYLSTPTAAESARDAYDRDGYITVGGYKILNHVDSTITAVYDRHSYDAEKRNALAAWSKKLNETLDSNENSENIIDFEGKKKQKQKTL